MTYPVSAIGLIVFFALTALADLSIYTAPLVLFGVVAAVIAIALALRK